MKLVSVFLLCSLLLFGGCHARPSKHAEEAKSGASALPESVRAIWISQFDLSPMCLANGQPRPREDFESRAVLMVAKLRMIGINTVFLQSRPNADALYPSALFPPSEYAFGKEGKADYDPFAILISACKEGGLSVHAWINPLRAMRVDTPNAKKKEYSVGAWIASGNPRVAAVNGCYYLDPAYTEVRSLVADGAKEILASYDVDGLVIDDYFYPTTDPAFDEAAFSAYRAKGGRAPLPDFRRAQTEALVRTLSETVRAAGRLFGVSPGGNTDRNLNELFADVESWCRVGLLDYLCPQIYFGLLHETHPFEEVARGFDAWAQESRTPMIVGVTLEKAANASVGGEDIYAGSGRREWIESRDVLRRCVEATQALPSCRGVALFSYRLLFSPENGADNEATAAECEALFPVFKEMGW